MEKLNNGLHPINQYRKMLEGINLQHLATSNVTVNQCIHNIQVQQNTEAN